MKPLHLSRLIAAVALVATACNAAPAAAPAAPATAPTEAPAPTQPPAPTEAPAATAAPAATEAPAPTEAPTETPAAQPPAAQAVVYQINSSGSEASFTLNEELLGVPTVVVGVTPKVAGTITVDWSNPANTKISKLEIDATDFKTDNERRNGAIHRFILQTGQYPTIEFEPTAIEGLPSSAKPGDVLNFKVTGNLKIRDITNPVTFDVTATAGEDEISGEAKTVVTRTAYQLSIPSVPSVANVTEEVTLTLKFVATKQ